MAGRLRGGVVVLVVAALGLAACGGGGSKAEPTTSSDSTDVTDSSASTNPKDSKLSKDATQLIDALDDFNDHINPLLKELGADTQTQALADMNADSAQIRTVQFDFDTAVRAIKFPAKVTSHVNAFLAASADYIAALDDESSSKTVEEFKTKHEASLAAFDPDRAAIATLRSDVGLPAHGDPRRFAPDDLPVAFTDDMSKDRGSWFHGEVKAPAGTNGGVAFFDDKGYHLNSIEGSIETAPDKVADLSDASVETDVTKTDGADHPFSDDETAPEVFGVMCRVGKVANGVRSGYLFLISSSGDFRVAVLGEDGITNTLDSSRSPEPAIKTGVGAKNHVRADCIDDHLTMFVNEVPVSQVTDRQLSSGNVGVYAGAFVPAGTKARSAFDVAYENYVARGR